MDVFSIILINKLIIYFYLKFWILIDCYDQHVNEHVPSAYKGCERFLEIQKLKIIHIKLLLNCAPPYIEGAYNLFHAYMLKRA